MPYIPNRAWIGNRWAPPNMQLRQQECFGIFRLRSHLSDRRYHKSDACTSKSVVDNPWGSKSDPQIKYPKKAIAGAHFCSRAALAGATITEFGRALGR